MVAAGFPGRVCQCQSRGMSSVCHPRDSAGGEGRWGFLGAAWAGDTGMRVSRQCRSQRTTGRSLQAG